MYKNVSWSLLHSPNTITYLDVAVAVCCPRLGRCASDGVADGDASPSLSSSAVAVAPFVVFDAASFCVLADVEDGFLVVLELHAQRHKHI